jgi:hypothetical protein
LDVESYHGRGKLLDERRNATIANRRPENRTEVDKKEFPRELSSQIAEKISSSFQASKSDQLRTPNH